MRYLRVIGAIVVAVGLAVFGSFLTVPATIRVFGSTASCDPPFAEAVQDASPHSDPFGNEEPTEDDELDGECVRLSRQRLITGLVVAAPIFITGLVLLKWARREAERPIGRYHWDGRDWQHWDGESWQRRL